MNEEIDQNCMDRLAWMVHVVGIAGCRYLDNAQRRELYVDFGRWLVGSGRPFGLGS